MFNYQFNLRVVFLVLIVFTASLFFIINRKITDQFRTELNNQVSTIVNLYHQNVLYSEDDSNYLLEFLVCLDVNRFYPFV